MEPRKLIKLGNFFHLYLIHLRHFHFHAPTEHLFFGVQRDLVIHTVMSTADPEEFQRDYAVLAFIFVADDSAELMPWLTKINENIDINDAEKTATYDFDLENFYSYVPVSSGFYHYIGGLTTPDCNEIVNWYINK